MIALTRAVSPSIARCELTHLDRQAIDATRARRQHAAYEARLRALGCRVERLPPLPDAPDGVFVEDTAVVLPELAIIANPGAPSRGGEVPSAAAALGRLRPLAFIEAPATLDGGDVLRLGRTVWVGASARTDAAGRERLRELLGPLGYDVRVAAVRGCLHLKTAVTAVSPDTLLMNPEWVDPAPFDGVRRIEVDPREPFAANALRVGDRVVYPDAFPRTRGRLEAEGLRPAVVAVDELARAEGGVTCCCILVGHDDGPAPPLQADRRGAGP